MISDLPQFITWSVIDGRKVPTNYQTGRPCNPHDPTHWTTFEHATDMAPLVGATGVGFVLTAADPLFCVDLDNCINEDGTWTTLALDTLALFPDAYIERSVSGKGLHIWGHATLPPGHRTRGPGIEIYSDKRFIALGTYLSGKVFLDQTVGVTAILGGLPAGATAKGGEWTHEPVAEWNGPEDDSELIHKMLASKPSSAAAFGDGATARDLWEGNADALGAAYPSDTGAPFNHSSADFGLLAHLAFWTGKDCERMDRLFRQSALYRDKWERDDYRHRSTVAAASGEGGVYTAGAPLPGDATLDDVDLDALDEASSPEAIEEAMTIIARQDPLRREISLKKVKAATGTKMGMLRAMLRTQVSPPGDIGLEVAEAVLAAHYQGGDHLVLTMDGSFWAYEETHWRRTTDDQISKRILAIAREKVASRVAIASIVTQTLKLLKAKQAADGDVLRLAEEPRPVINCLNGELWVGDDGSVELRSHRHDSYLIYCLDVAWDPSAKAPTFERALREIFNGDQELVRHFMEFMGYTVQPSRRMSYGRKLVTALSGGVFDLLDPVLERYSFDEFGELA